VTGSGSVTRVKWFERDPGGATIYITPPPGDGPRGLELCSVCNDLAELEIPDAAVAAGTDQFGDIGTVRYILVAAAPIIVAAELRRLAVELYDGPQRWPASKVALLRNRADELDPGAGNG